MKHKLSICVTNGLRSEGVVSYQKIPVREKLLTWLMGAKRDLVILLPGSTVNSVAITEIGEDKESGVASTVDALSHTR